MRKTRISVTIGCCLIAVALLAWAQSTRKPGLWEMTTTMTYQQSPFPPGMPATAIAAMGGPHTVQVCLTQAMIDKYGAPMSQNRDCQITNIVLKPTGMTADMVCTGRMNGHGEMQSSWTDGNVAKGKAHFVGTMGTGPNAKPVEWTVASTSVYKGPDCGSVQPMPMPK